MSNMAPLPSLAEVQVIIVEDEPLNATLVVALLGIIGIKNTKLCTSGRELPLALSTMPRIDLILLDLQLPGADGFVLLESLRTDARVGTAPIVAVSAQVMPDTVARAEMAGFHSFIGKPLNYDRFPQQIRRILAGEKVWAAR
jgi:two-component system, cell cycle response regulator DivK